jgi:ABC-type molybdate transport system substrate-binding protein
MRRRAGVRVCAALAAVAWLVTGAAQSATHGAPLVALSSNGVRAPIEELTMQCTSAPGPAVSVTYGTSASIRQRVAGGEAAAAAFSAQGIER